MKKILKRVLLVILFLIIIYTIYIYTLYNYIFYSSLIEIQIPILIKTEEKDTHGGFHGDGEALAKFYFSNNQAQKFISKIKTNSHWNKYPMPEKLQNCIPDNTEEGIKIPNINDGYWFFLDRSSKAMEKYDYHEIFDRYSFNYTIAIFDINTDTLYIYSLDT